MRDLEFRREVHFGDRVMRCFANRPPNVDALLGNAVARRPDGLAAAAGVERLSFGDLEDRVARIAGGLAARKLRKGDRIGLLIGNRIEFLTALLAATRLGLIAVPLNVRHRSPELAYMLGQCSASALVYEAPCGEELPEREEIPALRFGFAVGGPAQAGHEPFEALYDAAPLNSPDHEPGEEDPFCILYTSGTTGRQKGAVLTHLGVIHSVLHYQRALGLREGDMAALAVPASHVTGLVAILLTAIHVGGGTCFMETFRAKDFLALAEREKVAYTLMVPAMYNLCLLQPEFEKRDLSSWRVGGYGGAPMPVATIERLAQSLPGLALSNVYGATETSSPVSVLPPEDTMRCPESVGRLLPCADVLVMDDEGREVSPGERGELWIGGPMVVPHYWENLDADAAAFRAGYWRSGDIGSIDSEGFLRVHDRMKDVINRGGYKIYCIEVENVIAQHHGVLECAVVGAPDPVLGERVHAFVVAKDERVAPEPIAAFCADRLADYKVPERFTILAEPLPRNANGKVLKAALRGRAEAA